MKIHVKVYEPLHLRKDVLETAVVADEAVDSYQKIINLHKERKQVKEHVFALLKEIRELEKQLEEQLPPAYIKKIEQEQKNIAQVQSILKDSAMVRKELRNYTRREAQRMRKKLGISTEHRHLKRELRKIKEGITDLNKRLHH